jgi:hypothetical protein
MLLLLLPALSTAFYLLGFDSACTYTRMDAVRCIARHVDTNHDAVVSLQELDAARNKYEGLVVRFLSWAVGWLVDTSTSKVITDCGGYSHNKTWTPRELDRLRLTIQQFLDNGKTCLPAQIDLCMLKYACDGADKSDPDARIPFRVQRILDRAAVQEAHKALKKYKHH